MSRILILGGRGRLGAALARQWSTRHAVRTLARPELDVADLSALERLLAAEDFDLLVNGTGLTHVDRCETDREEARTVNADAPAVMARAASAKAARLIHFSTDYVFDGKKTAPYTEEDPAVPLSWYGETKRAGEAAVLAVSPRHLVVRVSWVFGPEKPSFIDTLIERARTQDRVEAIADKTSSPTFADDVAHWMEPFFDPARPGGLHHACNGGGCTWQEYGQHALDCARHAGVRLKTSTVEPIPLASLKAFVAARPVHTMMNTDKLTAATGITPRPWREAVAAYLSQKFIP